MAILGSFQPIYSVFLFSFILNANHLWTPFFIYSWLYQSNKAMQTIARSKIATKWTIRFALFDEDDASLMRSKSITSPTIIKKPIPLNKTKKWFIIVSRHMKLSCLYSAEHQIFCSLNQHIITLKSEIHPITIVKRYREG